MMAPDPVPVVPMSPNPFPVAIVVACNPDLAAMRVGANIKGCEEGQKRQADTKNQQFHFQFLFLSNGFGSSKSLILLQRQGNSVFRLHAAIFPRLLQGHTLTA